MPIIPYGAKWTEATGWRPYAPYEAPNVGYKYRVFNDNGFRVLENREIFYAPLAKLNDPLDCRIDVGAHFDQLLARCGENTQTGMRLRVLRDAKVGKVVGGPKIGLHESFKEILDTCGVFCLAGSAAEPLMWAHYSDGHRGFCIGFARWYIDWVRGQLETHKVTGFGPVSYCSAPDLTHPFLEKLPTLRNFANDGERIEWIKDYAQGVITEVLATKARAWRYEQEYRSIRTEPGSVPFPPNALVEIVFGGHADQANKDRVRRILSGPEWAHVRFRQAEFMPLQFGLAP